MVRSNACEVRARPDLVASYGVRVREFRLRIIIGAMADVLQRERRPAVNHAIDRDLSPAGLRATELVDRVALKCQRLLYCRPDPPGLNIGDRVGGHLP